jgi:hypothetical protein
MSDHRNVTLLTILARPIVTFLAHFRYFLPLLAFEVLPVFARHCTPGRSYGRKYLDMLVLFFRKCYSDRSN